MRNRRNINCLSTDELHDLREAFAELFTLPASDARSFTMLAGFHGGPPTAYCRHSAPGFFTWHRAYLKAVEDALRTVRCEVVLPYWDWSSGPSTGVPVACRDATYVNRSGVTVPNPLYAGPARSGGMTARRPDINTTAYDDLAAQAQAAMTITDFGSFQDQMNNVHGAVHVRTGGDMGSVPTAAFDPIFYLHHANIDRLWAVWQAAHPGSLPASEASFALAPFNRPFSTSWQVGSDVESTTAMGYRYQAICFRIPPIRLWELLELRIDPEERDQFTRARLHVTAGMTAQSAELRVFIGDPRATERTKTLGNKAFAGTIALFGHGMPADCCPECQAAGSTDGHADHMAMSGAMGMSGSSMSETVGLEVDITAALAPRVKDKKIPVKIVAVGADGAAVQHEDAAILEADLILD